METSNQPKKIRRYDLDWLRVIVFALLILYHVGMFFVPWGWHIKNNEIYEWLRWPMLFVNQWRLPILFVISGMGTAFALSYRSGWQFIKERHIRLLIPLLFGMLVIVPPQVYVERLAYGSFTASFFDYLMGPAYTGIYPEGNFSWHHLWFLPYLLVYSIILAPVFLYFRNYPENIFLNGLRKLLLKNPFSLYLFIIPLYLFESFVEPFFPITHNLVWDWFNFISSLTLFLYGFLLIRVKNEFWIAVDQIKYKTLWIGIISFGCMIGIRMIFEDSTPVHFTEAAFKVVNLWSWILTLFGYAALYLNRKSYAVQYCNQAVYPFYILHQTITVIIGFYLMDLNWGLVPKFMLMVIGTFGISWLIYEFLIRRSAILRPLFGVKVKI